MNIQMVNLIDQYAKIKTEIDSSIQEVIRTTQFIKGPKVSQLQLQLENYLSVNKVITCANGTDALQIALMALDLKPGDEVIVPAFTYVATAEVIGLLGLTPVIVDVDEKTFNLTGEIIEKAITKKTRLIVPVHLFGQCADMESIMDLAKKHQLKVVEDTAQAIGADYTFSNGKRVKAGCIGDIGTTSFFPSKNLGCFGDGGAMFTNDLELAEKIRMISNHGQAIQYIHEIIGLNSRLDSIQAAVLIEKLKFLDEYNRNRREVADTYDKAFLDMDEIEIPFRDSKSTHVFHQYTLKVKNGKRDMLKAYLKEKGIPSMIYYPMPLHHQKAFSPISRLSGNLKVSEKLCSEVLSLPIHTEIKNEELSFIIENVKGFFND
jgi:UDP-2-acetamido-2-deoxy-ribo-hexuluronate aminotransferase